jgi:Type III flagellar switch regulator (C-ring) FliN C-term
MRWLTFADDDAAPASIRRASFEERSFLPLSAACLVAGGIRETLGALLGISLQTRLFEPAVPQADGWQAIGRDAMLYRLRGSVADAAIVLRREDAAAVAAAAFGERAAPSEPSRALSPLERDVLDRAVAAIASTLIPVCGQCEREALERIASISGFRTYFEIAVDPPVDARIGVALSADAPPEPAGNLTIDALAGVELTADAILDVAEVPAYALASLRPGDVLARDAASSARLVAGGRTIGFGSLGIRGGRYALAVGASA